MNRSTIPCGLIGLFAAMCFASETLASFTVTDLGTLGGGQSQALGINSAGQVVGQASILGGALHAFYYDGVTMQDLNALKDPIVASSWTLTTASDINDSGRIVGSGLNGSQTTTGFLYNPSGHGVSNVAGTGNGGNQANALDNTGRIVGTTFLANGLGQSFAFATGGAPIDRDIVMAPEITLDGYECTASQLRPMLDSVWNASGWYQSLNFNAEGVYTPS